MNKIASGLNPLVKNLALLVFFAFLIFGFVSNYISEVNPSSEVLSSKYGLNESMNNFNDVLTNFTQTQESVKEKMSNSSPAISDFIFLIFVGAFTIPKTMLSFVVFGLNTLTTSLFPALTGTALGSIVSLGLGLIFSSLVITFVFLIVKAIRTGESER